MSFWVFPALRQSQDKAATLSADVVADVDDDTWRGALRIGGVADYVVDVYCWFARLLGRMLPF